MNFKEEIAKGFDELNNYAHLLTGQRNLHHLADEVLQEAIITALELDEETQKVIRKPVAYVKALIRRFITLPNTKFYRQYISTARQPLPLIDVHEAIQDDYYPEIYTQTLQLLECCFPYNQRHLFLLHLKRGWTAAEISEFTGISYRYVKDSLTITKDKLKELIQPNDA